MLARLRLTSGCVRCALQLAASAARAPWWLQPRSAGASCLSAHAAGQDNRGCEHRLPLLSAHGGFAVVRSLTSVGCCPLSPPHARVSATRRGRRPRQPRAWALLLLAACAVAWASPAAAAEPRAAFACAAADDAAACAALGSLYAATGGPGWADAADGWADASAGVLRPPLCSLAGVGCAAGALTSLCVAPCTC